MRAHRVLGDEEALGDLVGSEMAIEEQQHLERAYGAIVEAYRLPVFNYVLRTVADRELAEDLTQEVFLRVYRARKRYVPGAKFSTWLFTIARNLCLNEIRRRSRHPAESLDAPHPEQEDQPLQQFEDKKTFSPPDSLLQGELAQNIDRALADLPENQRSAILLCRQEDLSYEEIAEILGCSVSATKSLIHRGRETLKERLKAYLRSGEWKPRD